ncbi:MAG: hypothetical protein JRG91_02835 [Deltaproteobacteria bacterium]|nr:hypothetical protein [Deltaproteobacteria bacterium]
MKPLHALVTFACLFLLVGCGKRQQEKDCEKLKDRVILISAGIVDELQKLKPEDDRVDRATMEGRMHQKLDSGEFMQKCLELDPKEVDCLANAKTKEQWVECGFDQLVMP